MIINSVPSNTTNAALFAPLGRPLIGHESTELKSSSLKALEQSAASARGEHNPLPQDQPAPHLPLPPPPPKAVASEENQYELYTRNALEAKSNSKTEADKAQKRAEEKLNAQKQEDTKKSIQEEQYRNEQKKALAHREEDAARRASEQQAAFAKMYDKTFNISRHLIDIGAVKGSTALGNFLDHRV